MPPQKRVPPRKVTPPPIAKNDDITDWEDRQPIVTVIPDPDDDMFPENPNGEGPHLTVVPPPEETPPRIPSPIAAKARDIAGKIRANRKTPIRKTRTPKPRVSVDKLISGGWQLLAQLTAPINMPVAKVIDMQAPVAGLLLEDAVKNSALDRILQPIARMGSGGEIGFALLGPPIIVAAITQRPHLAPVLRPVLRQSLISWVEIAGPHLEAVAKKEAKFQEQYGQQIDAMMDYFFQEVTVNPNGADATHSTATPTTA